MTLDNQQKEVLAELIKKLNTLGHNPATSGNYSLLSNELNDYALISESGIDKENFHSNNFIPVNIHTKKIHEDKAFAGRKSSDETAIHLMLYRSTLAKCVLHSHKIETLLFADLYPEQNLITLTGLEMIKAFKGIKSHEESLNVLVFDNSQDIDALSNIIAPNLKVTKNCYGVILRGHGLYVWGDSVAEAKRHLEAFEYLFKYYLEAKRL